MRGGEGTERTHYEPKKVHGEYPPMLRVDGVVYKSSVLQQSLMHQLQLIEVGQVEHFEDGGEPQQEASANRDLVGETIYADARYPGFLFIETEDEIQVYRSLKSMWDKITLTVYPDIAAQQTSPRSRRF